MFCTNCGIENADGSAFCKNCGISLTKTNEVTAEAQPAAAAPVSQPAPVYAAPAPAYNPPLSSNPAVNVVKTVASSPLFLTATIAFSLSLLFKVLSIFKGIAIFQLVYKLFDLIDEPIPSEFYDALGKINAIGKTPVIAGGIFALIPTILVCIGLWNTYAAARNRSSDTMKTSGLTVIKVSMVIKLVAICLSALFVAVLLVLATIMAGEYNNSAIVVGIIAAAIIAAIAYVLEIYFFAKVLKSINAAKETINSGIAAGRASRFVAVMAFIGSACALFSILTSFFTAVATITSLICFGILIFKYNDCLQQIKDKTPIE
ncbi:MAG: zinc ribbon domain-containing protein [Monoglobales bacterium]